MRDQIILNAASGLPNSNSQLKTGFLQGSKPANAAWITHIARNAMVTNKTDIVRFQRFAHHRLI